MSEPMGRNPRVLVTFPPKTFRVLELWADRDGMSLSAMTAYIVKRVTDEELQAGRFTLDDEEDKNGLWPYGLIMMRVITRR